MRIVSAAKQHAVALHTLETHPNIGLDVFHDVANVECAIGVRQGRGNKKRAGRGRCHVGAWNGHKDWGF
jgi:hypothetical protein